MSKQLISKQIKVSKRSKYCSVALLLITVVCASGFIVKAQTQYKIQSNSVDFESEYKTELDKWLLLAYEGDPEAQFRTGVLYTNEQFDNPDIEQAVYWYTQASRQGHALAQYNLGHHFLTGNGVEKNEASAIRWWEEAAQNEHALAQFNIGRAYYLGIGITKDNTKSRYWFERAANNGEEKSIEILQQLGWNDGLTPNNNIAQNTGALSEPATNNNEPKSQPISRAPLESRITPALNTPIADTTETTVKRNKPTSGQDDISEMKAVSDRETVILSNTTSVKGTVSETAALSRKTALSDQKSTALSEIKTSNTPSVSSNWVTGSTRNNSRVIKNTNNASVASEVSTQQPMTQAKEFDNDSAKITTPIIKPMPVVLYTDPAIRSVLITIVDDRESLEIVTTNKDWLIVKNPSGMPVWIHQDYLQLSGDTAMVTGTTVNARSVPIISKGTVVGKVSKGDTVAVIDKKDDWFRVVSPADFKAWVKTDDYNSRSITSFN